MYNANISLAICHHSPGKIHLHMPKSRFIKIRKKINVLEISWTFCRNTIHCHKKDCVFPPKYFAIFLQSRYSTALYFCFTGLVSVGFGNVAPTTDNEMIFSIALMLFGCKCILIF